MKSQPNNPIICDCCEREVISKGSRPLLLGCDAMLCCDCFGTWYDCNIVKPEELKRKVIELYGLTGGRAGMDNAKPKQTETGE